ncbi:MAG: DUF5320 domain-containing protein [Dehalococcoidia bacterium]
MPNGYGRGFGGGGWGFGFRGSPAPWPYVGLGRGGLPRCGYFLSGAAGTPVPAAYSYYGGASGMPYYGDVGYSGVMPYGYAGVPMGAVPAAGPYAPQMSREQELDFLKSQAEAIKGQLEQIDARIKELQIG